MQLPLNESDNVTLDANGNGTVRLKPDSASMRWYPSVASVKCSTANSEAQCSIYAGWKVSDQYFVDGTLLGSSGNSSTNIAGYEISAAQSPAIWAVWTGGDPGAIATLTVEGTKEIR